MKRPRRKKDGSFEVPVQCAVCGSSKCEINTLSWRIHCWSCHFGGVVPPEERDNLGNWLSHRGFSPESQREVGELTKVMPLIASQEIKRRGFEEAWLVERYGVRWDGERLCWPAGEGWSRRAVLPWQTPKAITVSPRGLIGQHLLHPGCLVVVTEGDWKSASIPLPWVGVGLLGTEMTREQMWTLRTSGASKVYVMLDNSYEEAAEIIRVQLLPLRTKVIRIPGESGDGPDDIPRSRLVQLLLNG